MITKTCAIAIGIALCCSSHVLFGVILIAAPVLDTIADQILDGIF